MNLPLVIGSFLFFTLLVPVISWWRTRSLDQGNARTYFLADRKLPWIQIAGALLLTNLSTEQLIGLNGAASIHGFVVMAWEVVPVIALIAMAWYFLPRYWQGNITTVPEFLEQRFDQPTRRLMGAVFLITIAFNILPFVLYSGGVALSSIFNIHTHLGISEQASFLLVACVIGALGCGYVVFGGMKAVALSDTLYGAGLLVAGLLIPILGLRLLGDGDIGAGFSRLRLHRAPQLNPIGAATANIPFSTLFTGMLLINLFYWCTNQLIVQRSFGAKSFAEAQKGILATAALKLIGPMFLVFPGVIAAELLGPKIGNGDLAYAQLVGAVLPPYLIGIFAAVLLGAIISAFNGGLHSAATLFSLDIYRSWIKPRASEAEMLRAGKLFAVGLCIVAVLCSQLLGDSTEGVYTLMKRIMAAFKLPLLAVVAAGMLTRTVPAWAAKCTLVGGAVTYFLIDRLLGHGTFGVTIHWLHLAALNTGLLFGFMLLAGKLSPAPVPQKSPATAAPALDLTPWAGLKAASWAVFSAAILLYLALWSLARSSG